MKTTPDMRNPMPRRFLGVIPNSFRSLPQGEAPRSFLLPSRGLPAGFTHRPIDVLPGPLAGRAPELLLGLLLERPLHLLGHDPYLRMKPT